MIIMEYDKSLQQLKECERYKECYQINTGINWCQICNSKRFQQNFNNWTSGNNNIDKFI